MSFVSYKEFIEEGDTVILYLNINSMHAIRVVKKIKNKRGVMVENVFQTNYGALKIRNLIGVKYGHKVSLTKGWAFILHPTPELWTTTLPHRTQILYMPDISLVVTYLDLCPGKIIVEAGTGSGSLSHCLIRTIHPNGHLYTFDFHALRVQAAKEEFESHGVAHLVTGQQRDVVQDGFGLDHIADAVFLDLPNPWEVVPFVKTTLKKRGGRMCSFSPCIEQVQRTCEVLHKMGFIEVETMENLMKEFRIQTVTVPVLNLLDTYEEEDIASSRSVPYSACAPSLLERTLTKTQPGPSGEKKRGPTQKGPPPKKIISAVPPVTMAGHTGYLTFATLPPHWYLPETQITDKLSTSQASTSASSTSQDINDEPMSKGPESQKV